MWRRPPTKTRDRQTLGWGNIALQTAEVVPQVSTSFLHVLTGRGYVVHARTVVKGQWRFFGVSGSFGFSFIMVHLRERERERQGVSAGLTTRVQRV